VHELLSPGISAANIAGTLTACTIVSSLCFFPSSTTIFSIVNCSAPRRGIDSRFDDFDAGLGVFAHLRASQFLGVEVGGIDAPRCDHARPFQRAGIHTPLQLDDPRTGPPPDISVV
jgi:hypothetical protein